MRDCEKCIYHTDNGCSKWECKGTVTLEDYKAQIRAEVVDEFTNELINDGKISAMRVLKIKEQLKEQANETD